MEFFEGYNHTLFLQPVYGELTGTSRRDEEKLALEAQDELAQTYQEDNEEKAY